MKVNTILDGLIYVRGRSDHLAATDKAPDIRRLDIRTVVNLWSKPDPDLALMPGVRYIHAPMADGRTVPDWLPDLAKELATLIVTGNGAVLIQCHAGRNRSCLLAAAVCHWISGLSGTECLEYVRTMRPDAVDNEWFEDWLDKLPMWELVA